MNKKATKQTTPPKAEAQALAQKKEDELTTSVKMIVVHPGLYMLSVKSGGGGRTAAGKVRLPAISVQPAPGTIAERIQFLPGPNIVGNWLSAAGDALVMKVTGGDTVVSITSLRDPGTTELAVRFERLGMQDDAGGEQKLPSIGGNTASAPVPAAVSAPAPMRQKAANELSVRVLVHVRGRGDLAFVDSEWAGKTGRGQWLESFSITPTEGLGPEDIEYKGLTASGFESPWLSNSQACGTRGMAVPLVGFAIKLKSSPKTAAFDCEYTGYFQSGMTMGPLRNGTPCRSTTPNDPLEGLQIRLIRRNVPAVAPAAAALPKANAKAAPVAKQRKPVAASKPAISAKRRPAKSRK